MLAAAPQLRQRTAEKSGCRPQALPREPGVEAAHDLVRTDDLQGERPLPVLIRMHLSQEGFLIAVEMDHGGAERLPFLALSYDGAAETFPDLTA